MSNNLKQNAKSGNKSHLKPCIKKSDLIHQLSIRHDHIDAKVVDGAVREILSLMMGSLGRDERIEIRGFGSFCLHHHDARTARNPRTGESVQVSAKSVPYFKPGKQLKEMVNTEF